MGHTKAEVSKLGRQRPKSCRFSIPPCWNAAGAKDQLWRSKLMILSVLQQGGGMVNKTGHGALEDLSLDSPAPKQCKNAPHWDRVGGVPPSGSGPPSTLPCALQPALEVWKSVSWSAAGRSRLPPCSPSCSRFWFSTGHQWNVTLKWCVIELHHLGGENGWRFCHTGRASWQFLESGTTNLNLFSFFFFRFNAENFHSAFNSRADEAPLCSTQPCQVHGHRQSPLYRSVCHSSSFLTQPFPQLTVINVFPVWTGTSDWSETYFTQTAGVSLVVNQTDSEVKQGQRTLQSQAEELFLRDWGSHYSSSLSAADVRVCPRIPHWIIDGICFAVSPSSALPFAILWRPRGNFCV